MTLGAMPAVFPWGWVSMPSLVPHIGGHLGAW